MSRLFSNNATSTLASGIASGATSLTVVSGHGALFPNPVAPDYATLTLSQAGTGESSWEEVILTSRSGDVLTVVRGAEGSTAAAWVTGDKVELRITAAMLNDVGYKNIPQTSKSAGYTCVYADQGQHILHPSADTTARTFTIPANSSVPYPVGATLTFINQNAAGAVTIAITTDTMRLAGAGTTGSRTLAANGIATAIKITATEWIVSGVGLT